MTLVEIIGNQQVQILVQKEQIQQLTQINTQLQEHLKSLQEKSESSVPGPEAAR